MIAIMLHHLAAFVNEQRARAREDFDAALAGVCRACGCTDDDCSQCVEKTGAPCFWVEPDLCSACVSWGPTVGLGLVSGDFSGEP